MGHPIREWQHTGAHDSTRPEMTDHQPVQEWAGSHSPRCSYPTPPREDTPSVGPPQLGKLPTTGTPPPLVGQLPPRLYPPGLEEPDHRRPTRTNRHPPAPRRRRYHTNQGSSTPPPPTKAQFRHGGAPPAHDPTLARWPTPPVPPRVPAISSPPPGYPQGSIPTHQTADPASDGRTAHHMREARPNTSTGATPTPTTAPTHPPRNPHPNPTARGFPHPRPPRPPHHPAQTAARH